MSPKRRRGLAVILAISALGAGTYLWLGPIGETPRANGDETPDDAGADPIEVAPAPRFSIEAPAPSAPPPPPSAREPLGEPIDPGFCPEPGEDLAPYPRPSLAQLLNDRTDELVARARLLSAERGSAALRRGLSLLNERGRGVEAIETLADATDRHAGEFDFASAAAVAAGARAMAEGGDVDAILATALRSSPRDPIVFVLAGHVALHRRDDPSAREALASAFALEPDEPSVALPFGRLASHTADEAAALDALRVYLDAYPDDVEIARLAARVELRRELADGYRRLDVGGLSLRHHPLVPDAAARATLTLARDVLTEAARLLGVSPRTELAIVVYQNRDELRAVTCVPGWAGGVYDGTLRLSEETVIDPDERARIVRHEGLHAALAAAAGPTPYWFNEGLAQRFAHERSAAHEASWARIRRSGLTIPFPSLEGSFLDIDDADDARLAYHQSLALVNLLVARRGERIFADAVSFLSSGGDQRELLTTLAGARPMTSADLVDFLRAE